MSEKQIHHEKSAEVMPGLNEKAVENLKFLQEKAKEAKHHPAEHIEHLQHRAKQEAVSKENIPSGQSEHKAPSYTESPQKLKAAAYTQTMTRIRKRLNTPDKLLSRVVHQPTIESLSNVGSKTVARPSGLLGGGIVAFIGSSLLLYLSRRYGFQYNYLVFVFLFIGGFALGSLIELVLYPFVRNRKTH